MLITNLLSISITRLDTLAYQNLRFNVLGKENLGVT